MPGRLPPSAAIGADTMPERGPYAPQHDWHAYDTDAPDDIIGTGTRRWGWPETFIAIQLLWNLVLFLPGAQAYRTIVRGTPYVLRGVALIYYFRRRDEHPLPASATWLVISFGLLLLNLLHETAHWMAGGAQVVFQVCIAAPVFWMARAVRTEEHFNRVLWVFFAASAMGAMVGILQVYFPATFLPPEFSALAQSLNPNLVQSLTYVGANGREIVRPPGLSDLPGGAAVSGMMTMILGLTLALGSDRRWWIRACCLAAAVAGMTALYLTHVRSLTMVAAGSVALFAVLRLRQGRTVEGTLSLAAGIVLVAGAYIWARAVGGDAVTDRFSGLTDESALRMFSEQRGMFIRYTLSELLYEVPFGAGLGRWGMMQVYFGDPTLWQAPPIHVEIQLTGWLLDGGIPLWLLYGAALAAAVRFTYNLAVHSSSKAWQDVAIIVLCLQLILIALCMTGPVFNTQLGIMFWAITGALYGATLPGAARAWDAGDGAQHA